LSSRRVKKGPGRRPQSAKRQLKGATQRGWSILAAAREVGVSRTTGNNRSRGYKTYRRGQVVGFVPALERLAVRQISRRLLSQDERIEIADLRSRASCAATRPGIGVTVRSMPTLARPRVGSAIIGGAWRPTAN
jgi:transposase, IS30 family